MLRGEKRRKNDNLEKRSLLKTDRLERKELHFGCCFVMSSNSKIYLVTIKFLCNV